MSARALAATPFVGRSRELADLEALLSRGERLVTITGLGGIGKSRLAAELAAHVGDVEVLSCDLRDAASPEAFVDAVTAAVGAGPGGRQGDWLSRALLARGPTLLVLDPMDRHVASADKVAEWLAAAPELAVVAVSREQLRAAGEVVYEVGPLAQDEQGDAVELFASAVRAQRHGYAPSDDERKMLAEIARELDGVPLALELAASRMAVMGAAALLHRMRSRFEILRRPGPAGDRHGALEASIAWSWEILEPWEREALAQCTVFRGGFGLDAAEAVVELTTLDRDGRAPAILDVIESLRAKSLVRAHDARGVPGELRLSLYESVRAYAERGLTGNVRDLEARHARHYVETAESWSSRIEQREGDDARAHLLLERENLLAVVERILGRGTVSARIAELALRALVALHPVLSLRGPLEVYARHIERALEVTAGSGADPRLQARGLLVRGVVRRERGDVAGAERDLGESLVLAHHTGDAALEARALLAVARIAAQRGDPERAQLGIEKAASLAAAANDEGGEARAHLARAALHVANGDRGRARGELERALLRVRGMRSALAEAPIRRRLAMLDLDEGRLADARAHVAVALDLASALHDQRGAAVARTLAALADHLSDRLDEAAEGYRLAMEELSAGGFAVLEAAVGGALGVLCAERGDRTEARLLVQSARSVLEGSDPRLEVIFACVAARLETSPDIAKRALVAARMRLPAAPDPALTALVDALEASVSGSREAPDLVAEPSLVALLLGRLREPSDASRPRPAPPVDALRVGGGGSWFRAPHGERVDLARRKPLRLILDRLAEERASRPGHALAWDDLLGAGWPGEKMRADAGAHRVRVAVSTLRKLGLREALRTSEEGYFLDPAVPLARD